MKKNVLRSISAMLMISVCTAMIGCSDDDEKKEETPTLYTRLGGIDAISTVVDDFLTNVVADTEINDKFEATVADSYRTQLLRANLIDQICAGAGGPCSYKGKSMKEAHAGMGISTVEFNALVGDLVKALDKNSVPTAEKNELLAVLGPMKADIVED
ncbi:group I truncated hemoglobin [Pseudochryseolinea flava]|uniref:Group 1 truncated hemoglobin n=1 Tax=Pseudochryseolinea flava TaxID=2059302 RepID=A0A364Y1V4_9BACT|nr:group 1 truncated hemoglobin [Pseudochryseolinea flava]RAW00694.1 group 1 truncated hemoglobin [Pseudochryseolinea flava]